MAHPGYSDEPCFFVGKPTAFSRQLSAYSDNNFEVTRWYDQVEQIDEPSIIGVGQEKIGRSCDPAQGQGASSLKEFIKKVFAIG